METLTLEKFRSIIRKKGDVQRVFDVLLKMGYDRVPYVPADRRQEFISLYLSEEILPTAPRSNFLAQFTKGFTPRPKETELLELLDTYTARLELLEKRIMLNKHGETDIVE